jgi:hypothetical protein
MRKLGFKLLHGAFKRICSANCGLKGMSRKNFYDSIILKIPGYSKSTF